MELEVLQSDKQLLKIAISGKLDANSVALNANEFYTLLERSKSPVILDFSGITFLSSLGIRMFLTAAQTLRRKKLSLSIEKPSEEVSKVIRVAGLGELLG